MKMQVYRDRVMFVYSKIAIQIIFSVSASIG